MSLLTQISLILIGLSTIITNISIIFGEISVTRRQAQLDNFMLRLEICERRIDEINARMIVLENQAEISQGLDSLSKSISGESSSSICAPITADSWGRSR